MYIGTYIGLLENAGVELVTSKVGLCMSNDFFWGVFLWCFWKSLSDTSTIKLISPFFFWVSCSAIPFPDIGRLELKWVWLRDILPTALASLIRYMVIPFSAENIPIVEFGVGWAYFLIFFLG